MKTWMKEVAASAPDSFPVFGSVFPGFFEIPQFPAK